MSNYILSLSNKIALVDDMSLDNGYLHSIPEIGNIIIYDINIKNKFVKNKFIKLYVLLLKKIQKDVDEDPTDDGFKKGIDELSKLESILIKEYIKYLKNTEYEYFLQDIQFVKSSMIESYSEFKKKAMRR